MRHLPVEIWLKIFEGVNASDLVACVCSCRWFNNILNTHLRYLCRANLFLIDVGPVPISLKHLFQAEKIQADLGPRAVNALSAITESVVELRLIHPDYPVRINLLDLADPNLKLRPGDHLFHDGDHVIVGNVTANQNASSVFNAIHATILLKWLNGRTNFFRLTIFPSGSPKERSDHKIGPMKTGRAKLPLPAHEIARKIRQLPAGSVNGKGWSSGQFCFFCQTGGWIEDERLAIARAVVPGGQPPTSL